MYGSVENVKTIASLGGGPIGAGWAAHFLAMGYNVKCYLHEDSEKDRFIKIIRTAWDILEKVGISEKASLTNLFISTKIC